MLNKLVYSIFWFYVFALGSALILGFCSGILFGILDASGVDIQSQESTSKVIGMSWIIVPMVMGILGFVLGILGKLPRTKLEKNEIKE